MRKDQGSWGCGCSRAAVGGRRGGGGSCMCLVAGFARRGSSRALAYLRAYWSVAFPIFACSYQLILCFALGPGHPCFYTHYTRRALSLRKERTPHVCPCNFSLPIFFLLGQKAVAIAMKGLLFASQSHIPIVSLQYTHSHKHTGPPHAHTALLPFTLLWPCVPSLFPPSHSPSPLLTHSSSLLPHYSYDRTATTSPPPLSHQQP